MCVCVCARARRVRVRGRAPRSPARPTPASCSPRCDARRIPNARSHPPGRLHSHTHAHSRARTHPRSRTPGSALLGRSQRPLCPGPPEPPECGPRGLWSGPASLFLAGPASGPRPLPEGAPRASPLPYHARPGRGRARSPIPGRGAQLWLPGLPPPHEKLAPSSSPAPPPAPRVPSLLSAPLSCPCLSFYLLSFLSPAPCSPSSISPAVSSSILPPPSLAPPPPHRPALPLTFSALHWAPPASRAQGSRDQRAARGPAAHRPRRHLRSPFASRLLALAWRAAKSRASLGCR